jgi:preprotein translocase subunit SecD
MLEFPRWKYVLVALVVLIGLLFALPNLFDQDLALQIERKNRAPMDDFARQSVEDLLHKQQIAIKRDYLDSGRLILAFDDVGAQLKARARAGPARRTVSALPGGSERRRVAVAGQL